MDICYVNKNKRKDTPPLRSDKFHFFSKIHIQNNNTAINITEKAKFLTKSVNQILEDMNSLRDKDIPNKKAGAKQKVIFQSPIKKNYRKHLVEPLSRHAITNDKAFANMIKYSNFQDPDSPKKVTIEDKQIKSEKIKREASKMDIRNEKVMKRLGGASDGFLNSILMNSDKNFNLKKFLEVNMYSIIKQKKQDTKLMNYLTTLDEQPIKKEQKVESLDFSINEDIDKVNEIINNERAIFESITNDQKKVSNNNLIKIEEYNNKNSVIEDNFRRSSGIPVKFTTTFSPNSKFQTFSQFKNVNDNIVKIKPLKTSKRTSRNNPRPFSTIDETSHKKSDSIFKNTKINFKTSNAKLSLKTIDNKSSKNKKYSTTAKDFYKPKLNINIPNTGNINDFIKIENQQNQQINSNREERNTISTTRGSKFLQSSYSNSDIKVNMTFNKFKKSKNFEIPEIEKLGSTLHRVTSSTEIKTMLRFIKCGSRKSLD